jgi:NADPH:quinone reductase-like Zn-dependent oxidoreductase
MKAITYRRYGTAEVLELRDVDKPVVDDRDAADALRYLEQGHARGKIIITQLA